jgi:hypothetical protein
MNNLASVLSIASGFVLMAYNGPPANAIGTSIIIELALAPLTAIIAIRRGRSGIAWALIGLGLGAWALGAILLLPRVDADAQRSAP